MEAYRSRILDTFSTVGTVRSFPRKTILETCGKPASCVYLLLRGHIRQYFISPDGVEKTLLLLSRGDLFGEITALQQDRDQTFSQALTNVSVRQIPTADFFRIIQSDSALSYALNLELSHKFRILMAQLQDSSFCDTEERLKNLLYRLSLQQGIPTPLGIKLPQRYTHEELAGMISSTRSTVSRKMKLLKEEGVYTVHDRYLYIQLGTEDF